MQTNTFIEAIGLLLVLGPCLIDPFVCVIRRFAHGQNIFSAHKLHLYQRLKIAGIREDRICLIYLTSTSLLALSNLMLNINFTIGILVFLCFLGFYLDQNIAQPFAIGLRKIEIIMNIFKLKFLEFKVYKYIKKILNSKNIYRKNYFNNF